MLDTKELLYFLTVAEYSNITKAANAIHLTQPTLTRTIKNLEDKLGYQLFTRKNHRVAITEQGLLFKQRAQEIISLLKKTQEEFIQSDKDIEGNISLGCAETLGFNFIAKIIKDISQKNPKIKFQIESYAEEDIVCKLEYGLIDFALVIEPVNIENYEKISLPYKDTWGILIHKDNPLANKKFITKEDLLNTPLIVSKQLLKNIKNLPDFAFLTAPNYEKNIIICYNLLFNASILAKNQIGAVLCLDNILNLQNSDMVFIPYYPQIQSSLLIIWKKRDNYLPAQKLFLDKLQCLNKI